MRLLTILLALSCCTIAAWAEEISHPLGCDIKGNVGRNKRLFYVPDHSRYDAVKINKPNERWFCTENEALAAGWKPAGSLQGRADNTSTLLSRVCQPSLEAPPGCPIKGNINSKHQKIYHIPCSKHYEKTEVRTVDGERWFCSEDEARTAGWRAPFN